MESQTCQICNKTKLVSEFIENSEPYVIKTKQGDVPIDKYSLSCKTCIAAGNQKLIKQLDRVRQPIVAPSRP
jgi:hypothetical protein